MKYSIEGSPFPVVIVQLENGESMDCEAGGMSWMSPNMQMETSAKGGMKRMLSRESVFKNTYTATRGNGTIAFSSTFPGEIRKIDISNSNEIIVQKGGYLASTTGVQLSTFFQKKLSTGILGGEGFIMQKLSGYGIAFVELDGYVKEYSLASGENMIISTGYLAMMTASCSMDVQSVSGMKNKVLGGEGFFNVIVTGPGIVWVQTMPIYKIADSIRPYIQVENTNTGNNVNHTYWGSSANNRR